MRPTTRPTTRQTTQLLKQQTTRRLAELAFVALVTATALGCATQRQLPNVRASGNEAYYSGDYARALANYQEYVNRKPEDVQGRVDLGRTLLALGRASEAREQLVIVYDREPDHPEVADLLARAMVEAGDPDRAERFLANRAREAGRWEDYVLLGRYNTLVGKPDEARVALVTASRLAGREHVEPQVALADMYASVGDQQREIERLRMALWIDRDNPEIYRRLRSLGQIPGPTLALPPMD